MEKKINQMQHEFIERLRQRQEQLVKKFNAKGYVVAGYGGNTYYCFVGEGHGFNGASLAPMSMHPKIFDTYQDAECRAYDYIYMNGRNDVIELEAIKSDAYYRKIHAMIEQSLPSFNELF